MQAIQVSLLLSTVTSTNGLWNLYVFGPPGSGFRSVSQRYGSGSFYHRAKIVRNTMIPTVLRLLYDILSLKNNVNVPTKSNKQENLEKNCVLLVSWRSMEKIAGSGSISHRHGSGDPDPYQNVTDPQHWVHVCSEEVLDDADLQGKGVRWVPGVWVVLCLCTTLVNLSLTVMLGPRPINAAN